MVKPQGETYKKALTISALFGMYHTVQRLPGSITAPKWGLITNASTQQLLPTPLQIPGRPQEPLTIKQEGQNSLPAAEVDDKYISVSIHNYLGIDHLDPDGS